MMYDYIIIGAGPAGLYTALQLEEKYNRTMRILLVEKEGFIGGRTRQVRFHSHWIVTGAGVGRFGKDRLLRKWTEACIGRRVKKKPVCISYDFPQEDEVSPMDYLSLLRDPERRKWMLQHRSEFNFREAFLHFFSASDYRRFCQRNGYTDFERADMMDTVDDYGFEDNRADQGQAQFAVPWNRLMRYWKAQLSKSTECRLHTRVLQVRSISVSSSSHVEVQVVSTSSSSPTEPLSARRVVFAGSLSCFPFPDIVRGIGTNPFLRWYQFSRKPLAHPDPATCPVIYTSHCCQKQIILTPHLKMISYSDNENANCIRRKYHLSPPVSSRWIHDKEVEWKWFYWRHGTHFYFPLDTQRFPTREAFIEYAQHPHPQMFLVGELISRNQGWTEGALESVERILHLL